LEQRFVPISLAVQSSRGTVFEQEQEQKQKHEGEQGCEM
jgi:hypothetical protein